MEYWSIGVLGCGEIQYSITPSLRSWFTLIPRAPRNVALASGVLSLSGQLRKYTNVLLLRVVRRRAMALACRDPVLFISSCQPRKSRNCLGARPNIRCRILRCCAPKWFFMPPKVWPMMKSPDAWIHAAKWSAYGASDSSPNVWLAWRNSPDRAAPGLSPPRSRGAS